MRISDWRSDVCSSDLHRDPEHWSADARPSGSHPRSGAPRLDAGRISYAWPSKSARGRNHISVIRLSYVMTPTDEALLSLLRLLKQQDYRFRSEEHTSELQSLMRTSYAVFCLKNKT